jgi:hypothetical protein
MNVELRYLCLGHVCVFRTTDSRGAYTGRDPAEATSKEVKRRPEVFSWITEEKLPRVNEPCHKSSRTLQRLRRQRERSVRYKGEVVMLARASEA